MTYNISSRKTSRKALFEDMKREQGQNADRPTSEQIEAGIKRKEQSKESRGAVFKALRTLVVFAAISILVATMLFPTVQVHRGNMAPTLRDGEQLILITVGNINRGDIVAFHLGNQTMLKRVIATSGEVVDISADGAVYIDGKLLDEPYLSQKSRSVCDIELPLQVPDNHFFVMGDNRAISLDSRTSDFGTIHRDGIIGKTIIRIWPPDRISVKFR